MKRRAEDDLNGSGSGRASPKKFKKTALSPKAARKRFRDGLFDKSVLDTYTKAYAASTPYKHAVIHKLVNDALLRSVREEVCCNVQFTPKETDIYKIHQSGDLANLDGLDDESLSKLPSLLALRDAIYSDTFRNYISDITGCGPLSGTKTDMAINVYTPGCFLLCHDDVIGTRKVSYILYLTDPDKPWQPEWGGALRLYPVQEYEDYKGDVAKTPLPDPTKIIPPAWNQLSFFAVQPGESFHDVEEVYYPETQEQLARDHGRVRMAISGWFHIPQLGEEGYVEGEEEKNAQNSSLMQLQGNPAQYDAPQPKPIPVATNPFSSSRQSDFQEADLEFLLQYMSPVYLTPDTLEQIADQLDRDSTITLEHILCPRFAQRLKAYIEEQEKMTLPKKTADIEKSTPWKVAKPPHKHRFLFQRPSEPDELRALREVTPITELIDTLLPSRPFRQWLQIATRCVVKDHEVIARRFRRGFDYTLATGQDGEALRLELGLGMTPTPGWGDDDEDQDEEGGDGEYPDEEEEGEGGDEEEAKAAKEEAAVEEAAEEAAAVREEEEAAQEEAADKEDAAEEEAAVKEEEAVKEEAAEEETVKENAKEEAAVQEDTAAREEPAAREEAAAQAPAKEEPTGEARSEPADPETAEPETAEPETAEPETAGPETAGPETAGPETAGPETAEPETAGPETAEPETAEPETAGPETAELETADPETADSEAETELADSEQRPTSAAITQNTSENGESEAETELAESEGGPTSPQSDQQTSTANKGKAIAAQEPAPEPAPRSHQTRASDHVFVNAGDIDVGGLEIYMAAPDKKDEDVAIYRSDADEAVLFYQPPTWNKLTIVLRDAGILKFVKFVGKKAKGDRWDISATFNIDDVAEGSGQQVGVDESDEDPGQGLRFTHSDSDSNSD
ncbi:hypothetical protein E4U55_004401 [Claviceps digitariae]|nr:hypothetical protein E4U55_004401 [Claviceps digitariae]